MENLSSRHLDQHSHNVVIGIVLDKYSKALFGHTSLQYMCRDEQGEWCVIRHRELKEMSGCQVRIIKLGTIWIWENEESEVSKENKENKGNKGKKE